MNALTLSLHKLTEMQREASASEMSQLNQRTAKARTLCRKARQRVRHP
jgi:hypothetical protein